MDAGSAIDMPGHGPHAPMAAVTCVPAPKSARAPSGPSDLQRLLTAQRQEASLHDGPALQDAPLSAPAREKAPLELPADMMAMVVDLHTRLLQQRQQLQQHRVAR